MRDSNHRCVTLNRSSVTITSSVYDRRGLDCNSEIPLINSLNHLTFLTSNSAKVRETVANDGALIRLVSILHDCSLSLDDWPKYRVESGLNVVQRVERERKLAMVAWKWTLAFQCLVLTGTRGTEQIRKQVVSSGVIPILATVLDNYLLLEKGFDFIENVSLELDIEHLTYSSDHELSQEVDLDSIALRYKNLRKPDITELGTSFAELWESTEETASQDGTETDSYDNIVVSIPRGFCWGKIVPKADDVIWSLQLLAFISKYTHLKPHLQKVHLVKSLSLRNVLSIARKSREQALDISSLRISLATQANNQHSGSDAELDMGLETQQDEASVDFEDPLLIDMKERCQKIGGHISFHTSNSHSSAARNHDQEALGQRDKMKMLKEEFKRKWNYNTLDKTLKEDTYLHIISAPHLNLFPLVERFTVKKENERDMTYWSSVIMRNSCRKNETTGVRQCANFACGKWEDYPKRFAKCRRCKRTKYCSRECQLQSWHYHRYWCQEVGSSSAGHGSATNASERTTPNQPQSATGLIAGSAATDTPNIDSDRPLLTTSDDNEDISHTIEDGNALPEGA
ncbi:LAME_0G17216g1_1 [Lachancea meyersii CBS 8951]|uniref:LAME_0G17216g1_1 n=1 Tax=Lachancea meyersii CBS 8951 TaxID=1266667 RepID=A0A1G4KBD0_9SACH|nr:LAME_0G17216g1_1 [Lachancea meyersii CBS 8951]